MPNLGTFACAIWIATGSSLFGANQKISKKGIYVTQTKVLSAYDYYGFKGDAGLK